MPVERSRNWKGSDVTFSDMLLKAAFLKQPPAKISGVFVDGTNIVAEVELLDWTIEKGQATTVAVLPASDYPVAFDSLAVVFDEDVVAEVYLGGTKIPPRTQYSTVINLTLNEQPAE